MDWLVLPSLSDAEALGSELSSAMGYPDSGTLTQRSSRCLEHPTNQKGAVGIGSSVWSEADSGRIDMSSLLSAEERSSLIDTSQMVADGWFPTGSGPVPS